MHSIWRQLVEQAFAYHAYLGWIRDSLVVAYWDKHPNAKGHQLIADDLYRKLQEKEEEIPLIHIGSKAVMTWQLK